MLILLILILLIMQYILRFKSYDSLKIEICIQSFVLFRTVYVLEGGYDLKALSESIIDSFLAATDR